MQFSPPPSPEIPNPSSTVFTFVNSHLAAFDDMTDKRNADFHELTTRFAFESEDDPDDPPFSVYETDALFWMVSLREIFVLD
jgi:phosphatidylinositol-bisphosphatase